MKSLIFFAQLLTFTMTANAGSTFPQIPGNYTALEMFNHAHFGIIGQEGNCSGMQLDINGNHIISTNTINPFYPLNPVECGGQFEFVCDPVAMICNRIIDASNELPMKMYLLPDGTVYEDEANGMSKDHYTRVKP